MFVKVGIREAKAYGEDSGSLDSDLDSDLSSVLGGESAETEVGGELVSVVVVVLMDLGLESVEVVVTAGSEVLVLLYD